MSNTNNGGPAFPVPITLTQGNKLVMTPESFRGISTRDLFALVAMHAEIATAGAFDGPAGALVEAANACGMGIEERIAHNAYVMADAMLKARAKAEGDAA